MKIKHTIIGTLCLALVFLSAGTAQAQTTQQSKAELLKTISELRAEIRTLKAQIATGTTPSTVSQKRFRLNQEYGIGATNEEIMHLQKILATDSSIYPEGMVTGYFGPLTSKAVARLQTKYKLENRGMLTSETRDFINSILEAYGIQDGVVPSDFLTTGPSRIEIESEIKNGIREYKFKVRSDDDEDDEDEDSDESEDDEDEDDSEDDDEDEDEDDSDEDDDSDDDEDDEDED